MTRGRYRKIYRFAGAITTISVAPKYFNSSYVSIDNSNSLVGAASYGQDSSNLPMFVGILIYRTNCTQPGTPYLHMAQQRCYNLCPK